MNTSTGLGENTQIDVYLKHRVQKEHEKRMLEILRKHYPENPGCVIDVGCARGTFLKMLSVEFPNAQLTGIDISERLIDEAKKSVPNTNTELILSDVLEYSPEQSFDVAIASGILSVFDDFEVPLKKWLSWLNKTGKLFIFGCFNSQNVDTKIQFRNNAIGNKNWEGGLTSYSTKTVGDYLSKQGCTFQFERFEIDFDIPISDNPITSYTIPTVDGRRLLVTGANNVYETWFLVVEKQIFN